MTFLVNDEEEAYWHDLSASFTRHFPAHEGECIPAHVSEGPGDSGLCVHIRLTKCF